MLSSEVIITVISLKLFFMYCYRKRGYILFLATVHGLKSLPTSESLFVDDIIITFLLMVGALAPIIIIINYKFIK